MNPQASVRTTWRVALSPHPQESRPRSSRSVTCRFPGKSRTRQRHARRVRRQAGLTPDRACAMQDGAITTPRRTDDEDQHTRSRRASGLPDLPAGCLRARCRFGTFPPSSRKADRRERPNRPSTHYAHRGFVASTRRGPVPHHAGQRNGPHRDPSRSAKGRHSSTMKFSCALGGAWWRHVRATASSPPCRR